MTRTALPDLAAALDRRSRPPHRLSAGQRSVPETEAGVVYTQAAAGGGHTVLLRSDGQAVALGCNVFGRCDVPVPEEGVTYMQVPPPLVRMSL